MADLMKMFGYDEKLAENGVRMVLGTNEETEYAIICRENNDKYIDVLSKIYQANSRKLEFLQESDPVAARKLNKELMAEVQAKTIVVKIGPGITFNGQKIPDTWQGRQKVLLAPTDFGSACIAFSADKKNYPAVVDVEEIKKP